MTVYDSAKRQRAFDRLQVVLRGESSQHINRVLTLMIQLGIDPDEEFFLVVAAIGHLKVLIEDAPREWQGLFKSFVRELGQWTALNTEHLKLLTSKTQTMEALAQSCMRLGNTLEQLQRGSQELTSQLRLSISLSTELVELRQELTDLNADRAKLKKQLWQLSDEMISIREMLEENLNPKGSNNWGGLVLASLAILLAVNSWGLWQMKAQLNETQQLADWSMTKLGRIENKFGITSGQQ